MSPEESEFLTSLYHEKFSLLHSYALRLLHASGIDPSLIPDLAEELVQDTFHTAAQKMDKLFHHPNPTGWLMKTLQNKFKYCQRQYYADSKRLLCMDALPESFPSSLGNPSSVLNEMEYADELSQARKLLTEDEFRIFEMVALDRSSHKAAAQRFGITVWNSQQRLTRARRALRKYFSS